MIEAVEEDLLDRLDRPGELATRFKDRGCNGDCGIDIDRLKGLRCGSSFELGSRRTAFCNGALIASLNTLRVAFITSVASIERSLGDNAASDSWSVASSSASASFLPLDFVAGVLADITRLLDRG